jgi:predicted DNA-binding protein
VTERFGKPHRFSWQDGSTDAYGPQRKSRGQTIVRSLESVPRRPLFGDRDAKERVDRLRSAAYSASIALRATKVAISMDQAVLRRLDRFVKSRPSRSRSQVVQEAVAEKISRMEKTALAKECAKLDPRFEQAMADEGLATDIGQWPKY